MSENNLTTDRVLEQSLELNKLTADMLAEKNKTQRLPWIICGIIIVAVSAAMCISNYVNAKNYKETNQQMLDFFNQYEFYVVEETITQDTGEGSGNNVYLPGDQAQYHQNPKAGE